MKGWCIHRDHLSTISEICTIMSECCFAILWSELVREGLILGATRLAHTEEDTMRHLSSQEERGRKHMEERCR